MSDKMSEANRNKLVKRFQAAERELSVLSRELGAVGDRDLADVAKRACREFENAHRQGVFYARGIR